jgi:hypothetical protein
VKPRNSLVSPWVSRIRSSKCGEAGPVNIMASGVISSYYNPFAIDGGVKIPIKIHPRVPPRTPTHGDASKHIASRARVERIAEPSEIDRFAVGARKVTS